MSDYWEEVAREGLIQEASETQDKERLRSLAEGHIDVKVAVAKNPKTPLEVLRSLAQETELRVLLALVQNESFPAVYFAELHQSNTRNIGRVLAASPRTPARLLRTLATDSKREIVLAVAKNTSTPPDLLEALSNHRSREIFSAAQKNLMNPLYVDGAPTRRWTREDVPSRYDELGSTPRLILERMSESQSEFTRMLAVRAELPAQVRLRLAADPSVQVRASLARDARISGEELELLANDPEPLVRANVALNQSVSPERRQQIAQTLPAPRAAGQDQLFSVERQLREAFGRKTIEQQETRDVGLFMFVVGGMVLMLNFLWALPMGVLVAAACLLVIGSWMALFP